MGQRFIAICDHCRTEFLAREGGGFSFLLLHCEKCGEEKEVNEEDVREKFRHQKEKRSFKLEVEAYAGICKKDNGKFTFKAKARCPKCRSNQYKVNSSGIIEVYD